MKWKVISDKQLYADQWLDIRAADVELPNGRHLDYRFIRMAPTAGTAIIDDERRVLLIWRHRFITGLWGWEIPMGRIEADETPAQAAAREVEEETGWRPGQLQPLLAPSRARVSWTLHITCLLPPTQFRSVRQPTASNPAISNGSRSPTSPI